MSQTGVELTSAVYCDESNTYRAEYDRDTTPASMAVVTTVSQVLATAPTDIEPLEHSVDTGALDSLARERNVDGLLQITFTFEGCEVVVTSDGAVTVAELDGDDSDYADPASDPDEDERR